MQQLTFAGSTPIWMNQPVSRAADSALGGASLRRVIVVTARKRVSPLLQPPVGAFPSLATLTLQPGGWLYCSSRPVR